MVPEILTITIQLLFYQTFYFNPFPSFFYLQKFLMLPLETQVQTRFSCQHSGILLQSC